MSEAASRISPDSPTARLADWCAQLQISDVPQDVVDGARKRLLDYLASALAGATRDHADPLVSVANLNRSIAADLPCTVIGQAGRASAEWAGLLNSVFGSSGPNLDDYWPKSYGHPGVGSVPAALVSAELNESSGADLLLGIIVGYEVATRSGSALGIEAFHHGWHSRGGCNALAAAAAYLKAAGIEEPAVYRRAFGHAANMAGGLVHGSYYFVSWYMLSGQATLNGIVSAQLALAGLSSNERILDPDIEGNYLATFSPAPHYEELTVGLGEGFEINKVPQKLFPATGSIHATIEAAILLHRRRSAGVSDIASVTVDGFQLVAHELSKPFPHDVIHGSLSAPYVCAIALLHGDVNLKLLGELFDDEDIVGLQRLTAVRLDPQIDAEAPEILGTRVTVTYQDGTVESEYIGHHRGTSGLPLSWADTTEKFDRMTHHCVAEDRRRAIAAAVEGLPSSPRVDGLLGLLGAP